MQRTLTASRLCSVNSSSFCRLPHPFQLWPPLLNSSQTISALLNFRNSFRQHPKLFHLFPPQLHSFHLFPAYLNSSHLLNSGQLFSTPLISCHRDAYTQSKLLHFYTASSYTEKLLHTEAFTHSKLLHTASFCTEKLLHGEAFAQIKLFHKASFYKEKLLYKASFYTQHNFILHRDASHWALTQREAFTQKRFYIEQAFSCFFQEQAFAQRSSSTEKLLHKASVYTQQANTAGLYTGTLLHREDFSHSKLVHTASSYTEKLLHKASFCTKKLLHTASFYTEELLQKASFCTASVYTQQALTQRSFYTKQIKASFCTKKLLRTASFYTEELLQKASFCTEKLLHTASFYTDQAFSQSKLLHGEAFTHGKLLHSDAAIPLRSAETELQSAIKLRTSGCTNCSSKIGSRRPSGKTTIWKHFSKGIWKGKSSAQKWRKICSQSTNRNFHAATTIRIYDSQLQNIIVLRTQPLQEPWRSHATAICRDWVAKHNRLATHYCRTHRFDAAVPMHKVSQHMQKKIAQHPQRREKVTWNLQFHSARKSNTHRRRSKDRRTRRAIEPTFLRNGTSAYPKKHKCFVQVLTLKSHPWCVSSNAILPAVTCKTQSDSQDSTAEELLFEKRWRSHFIAICTDWVAKHNCNTLL